MALVEGMLWCTIGVEHGIFLVLLIEGVMCVAIPGTNGIAGSHIVGVMMTVDWGSGKGITLSL